MLRSDRIGETNYNNYGSLMTIVEYNSNKDIIVEFDKNYKVHTQYYNFKNKQVISIYDKTVYNVGYLGKGKYEITDQNNKITIQYSYWHNLLSRCYNEIELKRFPTYKDCKICDEWLCYQTFAQWFDDNYYEIDNEVMCLDKDILIKNNKIYSPDNCVFVPERINILFTKANKNRGEYPIGVYFEKDSNKFKAQCSYLSNDKKKKKNLGRYNTSEDAFYKGYKPFKENLIRQVADDYKNNIPIKLYEALYNYKVEITD